MISGAASSRQSERKSDSTNRSNAVVPNSTQANLGNSEAGLPIENHRSFQRNVKTPQKENRLSDNKEGVNMSKAGSLVSVKGKVPMYKNDVTVDNITVEIEPNDLIPRKPSVVKPEYPWRVGGTTKRKQERKQEAEEVKQEPKESSGKKVRTILPKTISAKPPSVTDTGSKSQVMIPVTLKTPCKTCHKMITASSIQELKEHKCDPAPEPRDTTFICPQVNCGQKLSSKNALQYHQKHCHEQVVRKGHDIMSIATNELVGGSAEKRLLNTDFYGDAHRKSFVCPYEGCNKSYNAKTYLIQHERLHTGINIIKLLNPRLLINCLYLAGERPYKCNNCGKGFSRVLDLKKHNLLKVCTR